MRLRYDTGSEFSVVYSEFCRYTSKCMYVLLVVVFHLLRYEIVVTRKKKRVDINDLKDIICR